MPRRKVETIGTSPALRRIQEIREDVARLDAGETMEQVRGKKAWEEGYTGGRPTPRSFSNRVAVTVSVSPENLKRLNQLCVARDKMRGRMVDEILQDYFGRMELERGGGDDA